MSKSNGYLEEGTARYICDVICELYASLASHKKEELMNRVSGEIDEAEFHCGYVCGIERAIAELESLSIFRPKEGGE